MNAAARAVTRRAPQCPGLTPLPLLSPVVQSLSRGSATALEGLPQGPGHAFLPGLQPDKASVFTTSRPLTGPGKSPRPVYSQGFPAESSAEAETGSQGPDRAGVQLQL